MEKDLIKNGYLAEDGTGYLDIFKSIDSNGTLITGHYPISGLEDYSPSIMGCLIQHNWLSNPKASEAYASKWASLQVFQEGETPALEQVPAAFSNGMVNTFTEEDLADPVNKIPVLLLLVSTANPDPGISVKLPPWSDEEPDLERLKARNVYAILVNAQDQLLVRGFPMEIEDLKEAAKEFIINPVNNPDLAEEPKKAIISLKNDRGTSYEVYLEVYNELRAAYEELWDEHAQRKYGLPYESLKLEQKREIRSQIPLIISEAEPTGFGED